jgi:phosphotransferase family enzyme
MAKNEAAYHLLAESFLARMAPQLDHLHGQSVSYEVIGAGTSGATVCRVLSTEGDLVLKYTVPANGEIAVARAGRELAFYRQLAERIPVRVPQLLAEYRGPDGIALLFPAYEPLPPGRWQKADYLKAARETARLHSAFWGNTEGLAGFTWLKRPRPRPEETSRDTISASDYWRRLRDEPHFANLLNEQTLDWITGLLSRVQAMDHTLEILPMTLCHGDCNTTNLLKDAEDRNIWVDWQEVGLARGPEDLSFLIQRASSAGADIPHDEMLEEYCEHLRLGTGDPVSLQLIRQAVETVELRSYTLYWPEYMAGASEERLRNMLERMRVLAHSLKLS